MKDKNIYLEFSEIETKRTLKFIRSRTKKYPANEGAIGGRFTYIVTPYGVGLGIEILDNVTGEVENVTDMDSW